MKNQSLLLGGFVALLVLTGCKTHVPMVKYHPPTYQKQTDAVAHWKWLVGEVCQSLASNKACAGKAICVEMPPANAAAFDQAYAKMLKTELLSRSWRVVENEDQAPLRLSFDSQLVEHGSRGFLDNQTTIWGGIAYSVAHCFSGNNDVTWWNYLAGDTDSTEAGTRKELIVTVFVREAGVPVLGVTQMVYVTANDGHLYQASAGDADWREAEARAKSL